MGRNFEGKSSLAPAVVLGAALLVSSLVAQSLACTTVIVGKDASADGSLLASHSDDAGPVSDARLFYVPAMNYSANAKRPVYPAPETYPRYVGSSRGSYNYQPEFGQNISVPLGYIPQVEHTYAYYEATYGIMNEHGLGIAESTCSCLKWPKTEESSAPKAIMSIDELSRIALERCSTSRCAVETMGSIAVEFGFYGPDSFEGIGESLMVVDDTEGFVFHILPDDTGTSAVWIAARVADNMIASVANMFVVREVDFTNSNKFLYSPNMVPLALKYNLWKKGEPFDFTKIYSDGEYAHKYYSGRRVWRVFNLLAPSANLSSSYGNLKDDAPYPFEVTPDGKVDPQSLFSVHRDYYQNTPFDLSSGMASGPYGNPNRYEGGAGERAVQGNWERPISLFRSTFTHIVQVKAGLPKEVKGTLWFGPHAAHGTAYVPFFSGMTSAPEPYRHGRQGILNRTSAYWAHRYVANLCCLNFNLMIQDLRKEQQSVESRGLELQKTVWNTFGKPGKDESWLTTVATQLATDTVARWWSLTDSLMLKFADGFITTFNGPQDAATSPGYPAWWLKEVGYPNGPPPPQTA